MINSVADRSDQKKPPRIAVIGDRMRDIDQHMAHVKDHDCVPVVRHVETVERSGGSAIVAEMCVALGATVFSVGLGESVKRRIFVDGRFTLRVDDDRSENPTRADLAQWSADLCVFFSGQSRQSRQGRRKRHFCEDCYVKFHTIAFHLTKHGSDKDMHHCYGPLYDFLLGHNRDRREPILEIGIHRGASLRAWADAFPNATVHGIDINSAATIDDHPRIVTHLLDVKDSLSLLDIAAASGPFQLIVDDGSHNINDIIIAFGVLYPFLDGDGYYVIEDIANDGYLQRLALLPGAKVFDMRHKTGRFDDVLVVLTGQSHRQI